jgi:curved DNA-binding protein
MAFIDYYKILGILPTATQKEIKNAYRKSARKYHPDLHPNDKTALRNFQEINEANEVLSDPEKRKKYDQFGKDWQHADEYEKAKQEQSSYSRRQGTQDTSREGDFSDFFESMFGQSAGAGWKRQAKYKGEDYNTELHLHLIDAYTSHKQTFTVNGKNIRITIPSGIENGQIIKINGHGGPGTNGGPNGDLFISITIANQPDIKRKGNNLYTSVDLDLYKAMLGGEIIINTLNGKVKLNVKPETQNGTIVKLKGKGFPVYKKEGVFGDLFVTYIIKIPTHLSERHKELIAELAKL